MVRGIHVKQIFRKDPIPDKPINFPPFEGVDLHLEMLEIKKKVRKGAPLIATVSRQKKMKEQYSSEHEDNVNDIAKPVPAPSRFEGLEKSHQKEHSKKRDKGKRSERPALSDDEQDLIFALGGDDDDAVSHTISDDTDGDDIEDGDDEDIDEDDIEEEEEEEDEFAGMTPEEKETYQKEEIIWGFRKLKKHYKSGSVPIPEFNEHSDLPTMQKAYNRTVREIHLDESVESFRSYLVGGFIHWFYPNQLD